MPPYNNVASVYIIMINMLIPLQGRLFGVEISNMINAFGHLQHSHSDREKRISI